MSLKLRNMFPEKEEKNPQEKDKFSNKDMSLLLNLLSSGNKHKQTEEMKRRTSLSWILVCKLLYMLKPKKLEVSENYNVLIVKHSVSTQRISIK